MRAGLHCPPRAGGGIGRRARLRALWPIGPWRFKSSPAHGRKRTRPFGPRFRLHAAQVGCCPMREACAAAVDAALGAGASYADARGILRRSQSVGTRDGRVVTLTDAESEGIGVRVLVGGSWGFACDRRRDAAGAREAAR